MTERNIDIELIMALAEGSLPSEEAAAAEESLSDDARAELASQRTARSALSGMSSARLSDDERLALHDAVRNATAQPEATVTALRVRQRESQRERWYFRALPALGAAAALVIVVGIGINSLSRTFSDETATQPMSAELATDSADIAAETEAPAAAQGDAQEERLSSMAATTAATTAQTTAAAEIAPESDGAFEALMMVPDDLGEISLNDLDQLVSLVDLGATRVLGFAPYKYADLPEAASQPGLVCWQHVLDQETPGSEIDYLGVATVDGEQAEVYRTSAADASTTIYVFVGDECAAAAILRP